MASDITPRCAHFARFNARLNGVEDSVDVRVSDVWESLGDAQFDLIVAHPPYVPALSHRFDFRDAGGDGEHVTRRIVEGAPAHLARGGRLDLSRGAERPARRVHRANVFAHGWASRSDEFDLVQIESFEYGALDAYKSVTKGGRDYVDCERWLRHFQSLEIERFAVCFIELRREAFGRAAITERRTRGAELESGRRRLALPLRAFPSGWRRDGGIANGGAAPARSGAGANGGASRGARRRGVADGGRDGGIEVAGAWRGEGPAHRADFAGIMRRHA